MLNSKKRRVLSVSLVVLSALAAILLGGGIGLAIASTDNIPQSLSIGDTKVTLPTQILDRNGRLLSQFNGVEHHQPASISKLPKYVIYALLTREDQNFFHQGAFSFRGTLRAALNDLTGRYFSGGSTITQQLSGTLFANRDKITIRRKLRELWYAFQIEKRLTKFQILQMYLNTAYFGRNNYGIEAASEYYFRHPASQLTLAEAVALIIQLADPAGLDWISHPHTAKSIQRVVLEQMVRKGYVSQAQADQSFRQFWQDYPYNRAASQNPFAKTNSKAPYFTSYVRQQLQQDLYGNLSFLRDGLVVHTSLNLNYQRDAQRVMKKYIAKYNAIHEQSTKTIFAGVKKSITPAVSLLGFAFNLPHVVAATQKRNEQSALNYYLGNLNPGINAMSMIFGLPHLAAFTAQAHSLRRQQRKKTTVEGALITLDDHTGEILAMVGGYNYNQSQFNRAVSARLQEGSSIKPLYYSAAISSKKFTVATPLYDGPTVFWNPDGTPYRPRDFLGQWQGLVSLRWALQDSINVPSLEILQKVGFKKAIARIAPMMGLAKEENNQNYFPHVYPLGLGIVPVAPINMARAYATFANQGQLVTPIAIKFVQDRVTGKVVLQPEKQLRERQLKEGNKLQIMSPQTAYIMVNLLKSVVTSGDLWHTYFDVGGWGGMPMAGKTGTTENWDDAWTVGFSPYYTTAVWFGFDHHGESLGLGLTGATGAGPVWAHYMKDIDSGKPPIPFQKPKTGLVHEVVDCYSGMLPTKYSTCTKNEIFLAGTEPRKFGTLEQYRVKRTNAVVDKLQNSALFQSLSGLPPKKIGALPQHLTLSTPASTGPIASLSLTGQAGTNANTLGQNQPQFPSAGAVQLENGKASQSGFSSGFVPGVTKLSTAPNSAAGGNAFGSNGKRRGNTGQTPGKANATVPSSSSGSTSGSSRGGSSGNAASNSSSSGGGNPLLN